MSKISTVTIGSRTIDLHAFTGEVVDQNSSTETQTTVHANRQVTSHTDSYDRLFVRAPDGEERELQIANMKIGVRRGNTVSLLWGMQQGHEKGGYIAVYNHDTSAIHHIRKGNNDLAGPPGYNMLLIAASIVGVIGLFGVLGGSISSALWLAVGGGAIYWIYTNQKKLMAAVDAAARALKRPVLAA